MEIVDEEKRNVAIISMKVLFSGHHNPHFHTITEYLERAILKSGHALFIFEDRRHIIPGRIRGFAHVLDRLDLAVINQRMLSLADEARPDVAIITGGHRISARTIRQLKDRGIHTVLWTIDAPVHFQPIVAAAPLYDHIFCQGTEAIELFEKAGIRGARWLPMACDPEFHHPVKPVAEGDDRYAADISFVGSYYPERAELFEMLSDFEIAIWGPGWEQLSPASSLQKRVRGGHTTPDGWLKIYGGSKIVLAAHYHDPLSRFPVYQASPRIFEALACGAFVICDDQRDVFSLFKDGEDLVKFHDVADLREKIDFYLHHPDDRKKIADTGMRNVVGNHTYLHRIQELFLG